MSVDEVGSEVLVIAGRTALALRGDLDAPVLPRVRQSAAPGRVLKQARASVTMPTG
jgi:hypothetical protein